MKTNPYIFRLKIAFSTAVLVLSVFIFGGSVMFKGMHSIEREILVSEFDYRKTYFEFSRTQGANLFASIIPTRADETSVESVGNAAGIPILLYHGVINESDGYNVLEKDFRDQMFALKRAGYETVTMEQFDLFLDGKIMLPKKSFLLTFDDGRRDSYYPVDPVLRALNYEAVMFVITGRSTGHEIRKSEGLFSRGGFHLSEQELKDMANSGRWQLESHGNDDHDLYAVEKDGSKEYRFLPNKLWRTDDNRLETNEEHRARIYADLEESKQILKANFGRELLGFAYPFGDYGQHTHNYPGAERIIINEASRMYKYAFYQDWPGKHFSYNYPYENAFMIRRINVNPDMTGQSLVRLLNNGEPKSFPYMDDLATDRGWSRDWGELKFAYHQMFLGAEEGSTGSLAFLDGTLAWRNYTFEAKISRKVGSDVSLIARYQNRTNYLSCGFNDSYVRIEQRINDKRLMKKEKYLAKRPPLNDLTLGISVDGQQVSCLLGGEVIVTADGVGDELSHGGIGIKTWDARPNESELLIAEINVK